MATSTSNKLPSSIVCDRYRITRRTLGRWMETRELGFPEPITINKRHYFEEHALEIWERQRAATSRKSAA